jgi:hypothetical protein
MTDAAFRIPVDIEEEDAVRRFLSEFREEKARAEKQHRELHDALECDVALAAWAKRYDPGVLLTRAASYGSEKIPHDREVWAFRNYRHDSRRPVVMRGGRRYLIRKHSKTAYYGSNCANGWCERIAARYLRRIKHTCLDRDEHHPVMSRMLDKFHHKHYVTYHMQLPDIYESHGMFFVGGRQVTLNNHQRQYIGAMHKLVSKTKAIEEHSR